ncbi:MAG: hypothetical protein JWO85_2468 [Candidatus Eremiobacteraeota bacterium]|nr:hypothetical protein [Candidatus Eremiobacteraeota bacterium]
MKSLALVVLAVFAFPASVQADAPSYRLDSFPTKCPPTHITLSSLRGNIAGSPAGVDAIAYSCAGESSIHLITYLHP